jgi:hypothetical protein
MELAALRDLLSPAGAQILQEAEALSPREENFLANFQTLARRFPPPLARAALETAILRLEGAAKFPFAQRLYWTRSALEQASSYPVASYRAGRMSSFEMAFDLGCSAGGDTLALAEHCFTIGLDRDPLRLALAQANVAAMNLSQRTAFLQVDLKTALPFHKPTHSRSVLFFDPARRAEGRRIFHVEEYHPPLSILKSWLPDFPSLAVKLSPGVTLAELDNYPAEIEFISLDGDLKEAVLWFGPLRSISRRATLLSSHGGRTYTLGGIPAGPRPTRTPLAYLIEPDPAILRAGLVSNLGEQISAFQLDDQIAYLTTPDPVLTPFGRTWPILDWFPFQLKRLRAYLRQRGVGSVTVKKRGSPIEPQALIQDLRLRGEEQALIFLTQAQGKPIIMIAGEPLCA